VVSARLLLFFPIAGFRRVALYDETRISFASSFGVVCERICEVPVFGKEAVVVLSISFSKLSSGFRNELERHLKWQPRRKRPTFFFISFSNPATISF
jgi:hypothetical protein